MNIQLTKLHNQQLLVEVMLDNGEPIEDILREEHKITALRENYQASVVG